MTTSKSLSQRDFMRDLFRRHQGISAAIIADYAAAERKGEIHRKSNRARLAPEAYAAALLNDGIKKGWFGMPLKAGPPRARLELPEFLNGTIERKSYVRWLQRKAMAHVKRDRKRENKDATFAGYKHAIHDAVCRSKGRDAYTKESLRWDLISTYDNMKSKLGRRRYKAQFALLPTVDHVGDGTWSADFEICAWRTNDAKGDLTLEDFIALCARVLSANPGFQRPTQDDSARV